MASEAHELRHGIILDGPSAVGWDEACPINETLDGSGNPPPPELQGFGQADPSSVGMTRSRDDPKVQALREYLKENNGIKGEGLRLRTVCLRVLIGTAQGWRFASRTSWTASRRSSSATASAWCGTFLTPSSSRSSARAARAGWRSCSPCPGRMVRSTCARARG